MITEVKSLGTLYKRDSKGKIREWSVEVGFGNNLGAWRVIAGLKDMKLVTSEWKTVTAKNVGKANATTVTSQAIAEAEAQITKQKDKGYFEDINDVDKYTKIKPMLAAKYEDVALDFTTKTYITQPKLDGIRCIARADGLWTRAGKELVSVPHVVKDLKKFFEDNPNAILDGELYNHDLKDDFNKITSLVRKTKPKPEDIEEAKELVQYHVYDLISSASNFIDRWFDLNVDSNFGDSIKLVKTDEAKTQEQLDDFYAQYIGSGYEGQMVRQNEPYQQNKRSKFLLKRKEFITEEYKVTGISEGQGNWSGCIKRFHLVDTKGTTFDAGVRGTQDQMKALLESGKQPEWATLRYFELTPDGIPRFPVVIDYGYGKRED